MTRSLQAVAYRRPSALESSAGEQRLGLETSRGATPSGAEDDPRFFTGFLTSPQVASAGLPAVADVAAACLPQLAESGGAAGEAVHLCLAYGLGARHPEDRLAAVDALLTLAARGQLEAAQLGADLGQLVRRGAVKPLRLAESARTAAAAGANATIWGMLRWRRSAPSGAGRGASCRTWRRRHSAAARPGWCRRRVGCAAHCPWRWPPDPRTAIN